MMPFYAARPSASTAPFAVELPRLEGRWVIFAAVPGGDGWLVFDDVAQAMVRVRDSRRAAAITRAFRAGHAVRIDKTDELPWQLH